MEPGRGESCPSGPRRGPAAPGEDNFPSPGQASFYIPANATTRGRQRRSPGSIPPRTVWKRRHHWLIADWLGILEPARGESCPLGQRLGPAAPGGDKFPSPGQQPLHISTSPTTRGRKCTSPGSIPPRKAWKPQPNLLVANWLRLMERARGESCPSGQRRGPTAPGEERVSSPNQTSFHISTTNSNNLGATTGIPRVDTAPYGVETPTTLGSC